MTYADDTRHENRLTENQVDVLNTLSGYEAGEDTTAEVIAPRTLASLVRRGLVAVDAKGPHNTVFGFDVLYAYI